MATGVYLITCTANARRYVGSSNDTVYRWRKHREKLASGKHWNRYLQRSWNKYGSEAFEFTILEVVEDASQLQIREQHWIDTLRPEFNLSPFANRPTTEGLTYSEESRKRIAEGNRRVWENLTEDERKAWSENSTRHFQSDEIKARGKAGHARWAERRREMQAQRRAEWEEGREQREIERRAKLSAKHTGKHLSEETKAKLRAAATEQMSDPDMQAKHREAVQAAMQRPEVIERHREGIANRPPMSDEHRKHIGEAHKGRKRPPGTGEKIAAAKRGKKHSPETIEKLKAAQQRRRARDKDK